MASLINKTW